MTTLDSSSSARRTDNGRHNRRRRRGGQRHQSDASGGGDGDVEAWGELDRSFQKVQSVLDRNRALIQQVNENHQSWTPDNMVKNVALIQEINGNISKVVELYSDLNSSFSTACRSKSNGGSVGKNSNSSDS